ncbi:MAG: MBL fold metallo-hydrolase [Deltaproteobacteria bacterium]|nr:MBL fold metallo-hydrolase [Deltaproteobacteria bacterium]MBN2688355.1 MBL fold metallo-hydrolase [Deltaproteobacteria bacterium]
MIREQTGEICGDLYSIGYHFIPAFLLMSTPPVIFDAGLTIAGPRYLEDLREYLDDPDRLEYIFLTHSHYDHCGAVPFLKRNISGVRIVASAPAAETLQKDRAVQLMKSLNKDYEQKFKKYIGAEDVSFDAITVDHTVGDGDEFRRGDDWVIQVIATPGHTRDSVSYYIPRIKALVPGEATGVLNGAYDVQSEFSSSYVDYLHSLERLTALDVEILLLPHVHILTGDDAKKHFPKSLQAARSLKERIETRLDAANGDRDAAVDALMKEEYDGNQAVLQDRRSFLLNLRAKVNAVAEGR